MMELKRLKPTYDELLSNVAFKFNLCCYSTVLRGHSDDVQDLAWAPGGGALVTGSVENTCIVWDVPKSKAGAVGARVCRGYVGDIQGVYVGVYVRYIGGT